MKKLRSVLLTIACILLIVTVSVGAADTTLRIYHTNDTHGRLEADDYAGSMGFARIKTLIDQGEKEFENVLYLDAGDTFHGQVITNLNQGEAAVHLLNVMGCDALTLGNHDFNFGQQRLQELSDIASFPLLAANLKNEDGSDSKLAENYIIKDMKGIKVGIFGLSTPETAYKTHPKNVEGLTFANPVETAKEMVQELQGEVDVIVALTHLGLSQGSEYTSRDVAENVSGIDVIIDGHSHSKLDNGLMVNGTLIASANEYDKFLGVVDITLSANKVVSKKASLITKEAAADIEPDPVVTKVIKGINNANNAMTSVVIGTSAVELNGERSQVRTGETNLGNLIADAMRIKMNTDFAITNGGGIRASIDTGKITKGEVITVLPFGNTGVAIKLTGEQVWEAIEHGVSQYPAEEGLFPQVSGLSFKFNPDKPAGERLVEINVDGKPIDMNKTYTVATNDFMAAGGDGYTVFQQGSTVNEAGGLEEIVMDYIGSNSPVKPELENRIQVVK